VLWIVQNASAVCLRVRNKIFCHLAASTMTSKTASILLQWNQVKASKVDLVNSKFKSYWCPNIHASASAHLTCMTNPLSAGGATFCMPTATSSSRLFYGFLCRVTFFHAQRSGAWHWMSRISFLHLTLQWQKRATGYSGVPIYLPFIKIQFCYR